MQSLIFVAVFALALCLVRGETKRDADEEESCTALLQCIYPLEESGEGGDAFCQSVVEARACQKEAAEECDDEVAQETVQSELNKSEFVCSDEGRKLIADLDGSPCADNEALGTVAGLQVEGCVQTLSYQIQWEAINAMMEGKELEKESFCPHCTTAACRVIPEIIKAPATYANSCLSFIDEYVNCAVDAARDVCGDKFGNLVKRMVQVELENQEEELGCDVLADRSLRIVRNLMSNRRNVEDEPREKMCSLFPISARSLSPISKRCSLFPISERSLFPISKRSLFPISESRLMNSEKREDELREERG